MGSNPVQAWIFFRLSFRNCLSCVVTARIFLLFDLSSAVQIYVSYIYIHLFILHGYITNSQYDQLPVALTAQLVEHCTGIADGHGFESRSSLNFFQAFFSQLLKLRSNCEDLSSIWSFIRSSNICFIYLYLSSYIFYLWIRHQIDYWCLCFIFLLVRSFQFWLCHL